MKLIEAITDAIFRPTYSHFVGYMLAIAVVWGYFELFVW